MQCRLPRRIGKLTDSINYVEYIESSGTQYIDSGFYANNNTRIVVDVDTGSSWTVGSGFPGIFGDSAGNRQKKFWLFMYDGITGIHDHYGTQQGDKSTIDPHGRHVFDKNKNITSIDGTVVNTFTEQTFTQDGTMRFFVTNDNGTNYFSAIKMYSARIYDNGTLVRDFRPAKDPDGVACLYDEVSKTYYYNKGTGVFTAGVSVSGGGTGGGTTPTPKEYSVTLAGSFDFDAALVYAIVNGTKYASAQTLAVTEGSVVEVYAYGHSSGSVTLNGTTVHQSNSTYKHTVTSNCTITFTVGISGYVCSATITTE